MSRIPGRIGWVAPLLVGTAAAVAAEVALGTLLYGGPGLMRSLTAALAVEGGAFALGLWSAPAPGPHLVDRLRKRWLLCLIAFLIASIFSTSWSVIQNLGDGRLGQALGLTFLAALPLYAAGAVIGGMGSVRMTDPEGARRGPGASVALGAVIGFVLTGVLLPRAPIPASLLVACLVLLSAGGMVYGVVLGARTQVHVRETKQSGTGAVRVEDRRLGQSGTPMRYLLEGEHVRRHVSLNGETPLPWDVAVARTMLRAEEGRPHRVLVIGGGASALPHAILDEHPLVTIEVLERSDAVIELARGHLGTEVDGAEGRLSVRVGNLEDLLSEVRGSYELVIVDTAALAATGGLSGLSRVARAALHGAVGDRGLLASGPLPPGPALGEPPEAWQRWVLRRRDDSGEVLVLALRSGSGAAPPAIEDFEPTDGGTPTR